MFRNRLENSCLEYHDFEYNFENETNVKAPIAWLPWTNTPTLFQDYNTRIRIKLKENNYFYTTVLVINYSNNKTTDNDNFTNSFLNKVSRSIKSEEETHGVLASGDWFVCKVNDRMFRMISVFTWHGRRGFITIFQRAVPLQYRKRRRRKLRRDDSGRVNERRPQNRFIGESPLIERRAKPGRGAPAERKLFKIHEFCHIYNQLGHTRRRPVPVQRTLMKAFQNSTNVPFFIGAIRMTVPPA